MAGPLLFEDYDEWADSLVTVIRQYRAQMARCRELNEQRRTPVGDGDP